MAPAAMASAMLLAGLASGLLLMAIESRIGASGALGQVTDTIRTLNFPQTVLGQLLGFLLFAGAIQVDLPELRRRLLPVATLATLGVAACTTIVSLGLWAGARALGLELSVPWAFVFGALISPTDPVAVLAAVRDGRLPKSLEAVLQGETLLNDGVGIVVFTAALAFAASGHAPGAPEVLAHVALESLGGLAVGAALGFVAIRALRAVDDYPVEVTITLALAMAAYAVSQAIGGSGPLAVVAAGLLVGDTGIRTAMSDTTQRYVRGFWSLVDEILNAVLFLLLGLELLVVPINTRLAGLWAIALVLVLLARCVVVLPWGDYFNRTERRHDAGLLLSWGGLHGALSVALALTLPPGGPKTVILSTTFAVVLFSILLQGSTFAAVSRRLGPQER